MRAFLSDRITLRVARDNSALRSAAALIGQRVEAYRNGHPGTDALRIMAVNPGSGMVASGALLHYYARRSVAYQLVNPDKVDDLHRNIDRVCEQAEQPEITMRGYVVSLEGAEGFKPRHRDVPIVVLTAADLGNVGLTTLARRQDSGSSAEPHRGRHRAAETAPAQVAPPHAA
jgi:hypothetical protein